MIRLSPRDPVYDKLVNTDDRLGLHQRTARKLIAPWKKRATVQAILGLGSLARGFADAASDCDVAVVGTCLIPPDFWVGERWIGDVCVDLYLLDTDRASPFEWDSQRKQAISESVVLYAESSLTTLWLRDELAFKVEEQRRLVSQTLLQLGWLGHGPRSWFGATRFGYYWGVPDDVWEQRGDILTAHAMLDQACELALRLLFLANDQRPPDRKWLRFRAQGLADWPPHGNACLARVEHGARTHAGLGKRRVALDELVTGLADALETRGLITSPLLDVAPTMAQYRGFTMDTYR